MILRNGERSREMKLIVCQEFDYECAVELNLDCKCAVELTPRLQVCCRADSSSTSVL